LSFVKLIGQNGEWNGWPKIQLIPHLVVLYLEKVAEAQKNKMKGMISVRKNRRKLEKTEGSSIE
jgi:hypothetical protein